MSIGADSSTVVAAAGSVALGHTSQATRAAIDATKVQANGTYRLTIRFMHLHLLLILDRNNIEATVRGELGAVSVGTQNATRQIINVAAGTADSGCSERCSTEGCGKSLLPLLRLQLRQLP